MQTEILVSGFGGQGILFAGQLLAYAAMDGGKEVTWIPSYGPEMRGGTANCTVIIADEAIGSPTVRNPQAVLAFNLPSLEKYESLVAENGVMIANASLVNRPITRKDLKAVMISANEIAESIGEKRLTNMVMVGALLGVLPVLSLEAMQKALQEHLPSRHQRLLPLNYQALQTGYTYAQQAVQSETVPY